MTNEAGLQFSGEPTERALRAKKYINNRHSKVFRLNKLLSKGINYFNNVSLKDELFEEKTILEALELMSRETTLNKEGE
jgi:hypothetical protein